VGLAESAGRRYVEPAGDPQFGDLFAADYFYDLVVRHDVHSLAGVQVGAPFGERLATNLSRQLNRTVASDNGRINLYAREVPQGREEDLVLAHGRRWSRAVVLSDDCALEEIFVREDDRSRSKVQGRIMFAPISDADEKDLDQVAESRPYDRFALPSAQGWAGGIAEFRRPFTVDARDVDVNDRKLRPDPELLNLMSAAWSAFTVRHGPLVAARNASKLAELLIRRGIPEEKARAVGGAVAQIIGTIWSFEATDLEAIDEALKGRRDEEAVLVALVGSIGRLCEDATNALGLLRDNVDTRD
jgi:hypothetical protein